MLINCFQALKYRRSFFQQRFFFPLHQIWRHTFHAHFSRKLQVMSLDIILCTRRMWLCSVWVVLIRQPVFKSSLKLIQEYYLRQYILLFENCNYILYIWITFLLKFVLRMLINLNEFKTTYFKLCERILFCVICHAIKNSFKDYFFLFSVFISDFLNET